MEAGATNEAVHRALADSRRARIVDELREAPDGLDVRLLAARVGLHPNTARWHLGILADAGLVDSSPAARSGPGRPRIVYTLREDPVERAREEYRLLASMLAGSLARSSDGPRLAESTGEAWGRYLVNRPLPLSEVTDEQATAEVAALLDEQGFQPEIAGNEIRMRRCPFHELAESQPQIVCAAHRGLIGGALTELGSRLTLEQLDVFVEPDLCIARLG